MYVNERTIDCGPDGRYAMKLFLRMGHDAGLLSEPVEPDFLD
jgi:1,4-dihydroxy-6-naphthoate synthase